MLNDQELISLVLTHPADTHQQLADRVGLPVRTLTYRLTRPGFREKLAIVRSCYIEDAAADAVSSIKEVLDTLRKEMRNQSAFPSERVKAATEFGKLAMNLNTSCQLVCWVPLANDATRNDLRTSTRRLSSNHLDITGH